MAIGDHLADIKTLWGVASCVNTMKCLYVAAEKGVDIDARAVDITSAKSLDDIKIYTPFGCLPCLKDVDFIVYGVMAVMSYVDDKGFGTSLVPRNGVTRAEHYQWIHLSRNILEPCVDEIFSQQTISDDIRDKMHAVLSAFEQQLNSIKSKRPFIVGEYSMADIHWVVPIHKLIQSGHENCLNDFSAIQEWLSHMKVKKSSSKENYIPYEVLPTQQEMIANTQLHSIHINV